jgi:tRNA(Ile)-lysidine synthase TilS/MesJ
MYLLKEKYKLRVFAFSLDNGFISDISHKNICEVVDRLGIDHIMFKPKWNILKKIFTYASENELYSKKTLERASTICTSCIGLVKSLCLKTAIEQNIPMIGFGWSPGQAPVQSSIMKNNPSLIRMTQRAIMGPLEKVVGREIESYFLNEWHYAQSERFPVNVHPMAWEYYEENMILEEIKKLGWKEPDDTDTNSSNCLLNAFANEMHLNQFGFHPYVWEIANMVREGVMLRQMGFEKIYNEQSEDLLVPAKERLGL